MNNAVFSVGRIVSHTIFLTAQDFHKKLLYLIVYLLLNILFARNLVAINQIYQLTLSNSISFVFLGTMYNFESELEPV